MKKLLPTLISIMFFLNTQAQIVTGFNNITDTDGNTHSLSTYLNDGKFVVLNFYLLTCGNCMATAPKIESIYQNYGQNQCNVVVLSFVIDNQAPYPTNIDCDNWAMTYGNPNPPNFNYTEASWYQFYTIHGGGFAQTYVVTPHGDSVIYAHAGGVLNQPALESTLDNAIASSSTSATACNSYTWPVNGATYITSGIYTAPSPSGCPSYTETLNLTITSATVVANTTSSSICTGSPTTLTGSGTAVTYIWDNGVTDGVAFNPTTTTTYTVTGTDASGCSNTDVITVIVNPLPTVTASSSPASPLCGGDLLTLTGGGASSYTWTDGITTYNDGLAFTPVVGVATYTVTGTDVNSCENTDAITVTVNALPTVVANATPSAICLNNPTTLTGSGASTYTWDNSVIDGVAFNPTATTTYTVTGTDASGCENNDVITVTVNPLPIISAPITNVSCNGLNDGVIIASATGTPPFQYSLGGGLSQSTGTFPNLSAGTYYIDVTDVNGCTSNQTVVIAEPPLLSVSVDSTDETPILNDGSATANVLGGNPPYVFIWSDGQTTSTATNLAPGLYAVSVTDANGCVISDSTSVNAYSHTSIINIKNASKTLIKVTDILGQETPYRRNTPLFYIYDDGTVEKRIVIE